MATSLLDQCAKCVASHLPFSYVESRYDRLPDPALQRILFWSFPDSESHVHMYAAPSHFGKGRKLLEAGAVSKVLQVGKTTGNHFKHDRTVLKETFTPLLNKNISNFLQIHFPTS